MDRHPLSSPSPWPLASEKRQTLSANLASVMALSGKQPDLGSVTDTDTTLLLPSSNSFNQIHICDIFDNESEHKSVVLNVWILLRQIRV